MSNEQEQVLVCAACDDEVEEVCRKCAKCAEHCACPTFEAVTIDDVNNEDDGDEDVCEHGVSFDEDCEDCNDEEEDDDDADGDDRG